MNDTPTPHRRNGILYDRDPSTIDPVDRYLDYGEGKLRDVIKILADRVKVLEAKQEGNQ